MMESSVTISVRRVGGRVDRRTVRRRAARLLALLERADSELSIVLCDDDFIAELNATYREKTGPTDVLSFAMAEGEDAELSQGLLGDVVISLDTAARQATDLGRSLLDEVTSLLVHGVLHLLGYDHMNGADERKMFALSHELEEKIVQRTTLSRT